jgi:hypothetical protein
MQTKRATIMRIDIIARRSTFSKGVFEKTISFPCVETLPQKGTKALPTTLSKYKYRIFRAELEFVGVLVTVSPQEIIKFKTVPTSKKKNGEDRNLLGSLKNFKFSLHLKNIKIK